MLVGLRRRARYAAAVALIALAATSVPHTLDPHHDADGHGVLVHDESSHAIDGAGRQEAHALHCLVCHLSRSLRFEPAAILLARPDAGSSKRVPSFIPSAASGAVPAQPPLRAPPAAPAVA